MCRLIEWDDYEVQDPVKFYEKLVGELLFYVQVCINENYFCFQWTSI